MQSLDEFLEMHTPAELQTIVEERRVTIETSREALARRRNEEIRQLIAANQSGDSTKIRTSIDGLVDLEVAEEALKRKGLTKC